jgi:hypothetical protein
LSFFQYSLKYPLSVLFLFASYYCRYESFVCKKTLRYRRDIHNNFP